MDHRFALRLAKARIAILEGQLAAAGLEAAPEPPAWAADLPTSEAELLGILLRAHPRALDTYDIEAVLPRRDHARDRDVKIISVYVSRLRKRLGQDAIETAWGKGYRLPTPRPRSCAETSRHRERRSPFAQRDGGRPMRFALLCVLLLGGCAMPISPGYAVRLSFNGHVRHRSHAPRPRYFVGLRLSLVSRP